MRREDDFEDEEMEQYREERRVIYEEKWWERYIIHNEKLWRFVKLCFLAFLVIGVGWLSGYWWHILGLFAVGFPLTIYFLLKYQDEVIYVVESRLAGDRIRTPDGRTFVVEATSTRIFMIPSWEYWKYDHVGDNGKPLPVEATRVVFCDYLDRENKIIYHSQDAEFANVVLAAKMNLSIIEERAKELREVDSKTVEKALNNVMKLRKAAERLAEEKEKSGEKSKIDFRALAKVLRGKEEELKDLLDAVRYQEKIMVSKQFDATFRVSPTVRRNLFLHYKDTIPDLRALVFTLQNLIRELSDVLAAVKFYEALGRTIPGDVSQKIADILTSMGYEELLKREMTVRKPLKEVKAVAGTTE